MVTVGDHVNSNNIVTKIKFIFMVRMTIVIIEIIRSGLHDLASRRFDVDLFDRLRADSLLPGWAACQTYYAGAYLEPLRHRSL